MTTKKLLWRQICLAKFLLGFNFVISYILGRKNKKTDSLIHQSNDCLAYDQDHWQQHLLKTIFYLKDLKLALYTQIKVKQHLKRWFKQIWIYQELYPPI